MTSTNTKTPKKTTALSAKAAERYQKGVRGITMLDRISAGMLAVIVVGLGLLLPQSADDEEGQISRVIFLVSIAIIVQATLMIRQSFARLSREQKEKERSPEDQPFKGWLLTFFTPVIALLVLLPWILMGVFNDDDFGPIGATFLLLVLFYMAWLLSALVAAFIIVPIELLVRGTIAAIRGDRQRIGYLYSGLFFGVIAAFVIVMGLAIDTQHPFPAAIPGLIAALFGIPGDYTVKNEALAWVGRILAVGVAFFIVKILTAKPGKS